MHSCDDLYGSLQKFFFWLLGGNDVDKMRCTHAFPHGLESPIGMMYYYPKDLPSLAPAPTVVWTPGLDGDAGQYDAIARLRASRGYVVAIPYNFINSFPTDPLWGVQALIAETKRPGSALHGHVDLSRTILGGHSGGAGAAFWGASYIPTHERLIDPDLKIIGALSVGTGIQAPTGLAVTVPMLTITGNLDVITPDFLWPRLDHATIFQAPAYIATALNGTHFFVNADIPNNPAAGLSTAWFEHLAKDDQKRESDIRRQALDAAARSGVHGRATQHVGSEGPLNAKNWTFKLNRKPVKHRVFARSAALVTACAAIASSFATG
ncbi:alpha/beta hydrolase [Gordonia humi]|uniref:alpha/beta hydrolase n=1 Tax=Gordonia humi TaxID=686429 RepID=UPI00360B47F3